MSEPITPDPNSIPENRPRPVNDAAKGQQVTTAVGTVITALAAVGALTIEQSDAIAVLLTILAPVAAAVTGILVAFGIVKKSEPNVTPLADPRDTIGNPLTPDQTPPL